MQLKLDYMEHDYMHMKGHGRCIGTSRDLKVIVKINIISVDMIKIVKGNFK